MNNKKLTPEYIDRLVAKCFKYRDQIIALREKVEKDFNLNETDLGVVTNCTDQPRPADPDGRKLYDLGIIINGLSEAWPGLEQIIEHFDNE